MQPHSSRNDTQPGDGLTLRGSFNLLHFLALVHALGCIVFLRRDFGREAFGLHGLFTIVLILAWGSVTNCYAMFIFFLLWLATVVCQRIKQFINWRRGLLVHSHYIGDPWIARRLFPRMSEANAKGAEAFLCLAIGGVIGQFIPPLGAFIGLGFVSIMFVEAVMIETTRRRLQAMRDAELEQRYLAEMYRRGKF